MPYVEGFGTWPFGEEWLWEALAGVYLPLLEVIEGARVTLGLTPVLCDQLEALGGPPGDRFLDYLGVVKERIHAEDAVALEATGQYPAAAELRRAVGDYRRAGERFERLGRDVLGAFRATPNGADGPALWTSAATHPVLPLLATRAGRRLQVELGVASHERRFGEWTGGFWLPECAYEPRLEHLLAERGVRAFCVDQTEALGLGAIDHLEPVRTEAGVVAVPVDWETVGLVWDPQGYPRSGSYRDSHRRTSHDLMPWNNRGEPYSRDEAAAAAAQHGRDFVARVAARLDAYTADRGRPGLLCCALDTELLGHWWYEGPEWLAAVLTEAEEQGVELATLPVDLDRVETVTRTLEPSSWGIGRDLRTWDSPRVADSLFALRRAELELVAAAGGPPGEREEGALRRAARELMAAQSSDWSFSIVRATAEDYARRRVEEHLASMGTALDALRDCRAVPEPHVRHLAPELDLGPLRES
jgi:1,4-alpha-glucan branching enzyme